MTAITARAMRRLAANDNAGGAVPTAMPAAWSARLEAWRCALLEHADAVLVVAVAAGLATALGLVPL